MKTCILGVFAFFIFKGQCLNINRYNATDSPIFPGIIGGDVAKHGEFPYQVSIQHKTIFGQRHVCGGAIVTDTYIVTAAHCITSLAPNTILVVAGMTSLVNDVSSKQQIRANSKVVHEHYSTVTNDNDIAIIKLEEALVLNDLVKPIDLPTEEVSKGVQCTMTGWGATTETGDAVLDLHKVQLPVVDTSLCKTFYGESAISDGMLCAGKISGGSGSCYGDEGGPLQCSGVLQGIASWRKGCAQPASPGVYTKVFHFKNWIDQYITDD